MNSVVDLYPIMENAKIVEEETFDLRFEEVSSLIDQEKLQEALSLIKTVLSEGAVDIRLLIYQFYIQFALEGLQSIEKVFPSMITIMTDHWEKISPVNLRDKYFWSSLAWFLSTIVKKLKRSEKLLKDKRDDEFWNRAVATLSYQDIERLLIAVHQFAEFVVQKMQQPSLSQPIMYIAQWLESLKTLIQEPKAEETLPELHATSLESPTTTFKNEIGLKEILASSEAIQHLFRKIRAFESLIEAQDFYKAALVSDDIAQIIKSFDPTIFFPKLFSRYFSLSATYIDSLSQEWESKGSLKWDTLNRLYQTDLDEFIEW